MAVRVIRRALESRVLSTETEQGVEIIATDAPHEVFG